RLIGKHDRIRTAPIASVRAVTKKPLRVDANEGFKSKEEAVEKINWLEKQGVEFIEQPLPAANLEDMNWIRKRVHMPIIADEACLHPSDIPKLAPHFDGVNIKIDKCGGLLEGWRMIQLARSLEPQSDVGLHGAFLGRDHSRGAALPTGGLCGSRWFPADLERPL
ncbi:MAG: enolase C-terminal domain-like protein, partial [Paludibaculum sp.]